MERRCELEFCRQNISYTQLLTMESERNNNAHQLPQKSEFKVFFFSLLIRRIEKATTIADTRRLETKGSPREHPTIGFVLFSTARRSLSSPIKTLNGTLSRREAPPFDAHARRRVTSQAVLGFFFHLTVRISMTTLVSAILMVSFICLFINT